MPDVWNESELAELIEGTLPPKREAKLRRKIERDPKLRALVERLIGDRDVLRRTEDPALPRDFLADLEPRLVRPMLVGTPPGAYRRQHRREARRRMIPRVAAAAGIVLALAAGMWLTIDQVLWPRMARLLAREGDSIISPRADETTTALAERDVSIAAVATSDGGAADEIASSTSAAQPLPSEAGEGVLAPVEFALVFAAGPHDQAEQTVLDAAAEIGDTTAVVRNVTFEEAQVLAGLYLREITGRQPDGPPAYASVTSPGEIKKRASREHRRRRSRRVDLQQLLPDGVLPGEHLMGDESIAPSFEQQLEYAQQGALLTVSVPLDDLPALLDRLSVTTAHRTHLRVLAADTDGASPPSFADRAEIQRMLDNLRAECPRATILLPVVVEPIED